MIFLKSLTLKPVLLTAAIVGAAALSAHAAVLASTDFDSSSIGGSSNIKTGLAWSLNGLDDPGDMAALNAGGGAQALFNSNAFNQDLFGPALNTGNGNTFWITDISITVATGFNVTLTDVTLNAVSISGGGTENVNRRNDYTAFLFNPSDVLIEEVTVADTTAGNQGAGQPLVTLDFADTALSLPGTYTLRIKGGDFVPPDETGNHTAFDNLSINGTATAIPEASSWMVSLLGMGMILLRRRA